MAPSWESKTKKESRLTDLADKRQINNQACFICSAFLIGQNITNFFGSTFLKFHVEYL